MDNNEIILPLLKTKTMKKYIIKTGFVLFLGVLLFLSCKKESAVDSVNSPIPQKPLKIEGRWGEVSKEYECALYEGAIYNFLFRCDSFYLIIDNFSDMVWPTDTCALYYYSINQHYNYVRGRYKLEGDSLFLSGYYYSDSSYTQLKTTNCIYDDRVGEYVRRIKYVYENDTLKLSPKIPIALPRDYEIHLVQTKKDSCGNGIHRGG